MIEKKIIENYLNFTRATVRTFQDAADEAIEADEAKKLVLNMMSYFQK